MKTNTKLKNLFATSGSVAQETIIEAMICQKIAQDRPDAICKIRTLSTKEKANIEREILVGLESLANSLKINLASLIKEENLKLLRMATSYHIVTALCAVHERFVKNTLFDPDSIVDMYFHDSIYKLRNAYTLPWDEVKNELIYIRHYLKKGGNTIPDEIIEEEFTFISSENLKRNELDPLVIASELYLHERFIDCYINKYKHSFNLDKKEDAKIIKRINTFLKKNKTNAKMIQTIVGGLYIK